MHKYRRLVLTVLTVVALTVPHLADARAGGGRSMGSMGSRTFRASPSAAPIQRSTTAVPSPAQPGLAQPGFNPVQPALGGSPFWRGMAGGFLGAGIGSMLFGGNSFGGGMGGYGGGGGMFGGLLQIILFGGLIYFVVRMFRGGISSNNSAPIGNFSSNFANSNYAGNAADTSTPLTVTDSDKDYFEQLLLKIQHHWSEGDLTKLRSLVTPEMLQYFSEELSTNASRGLANKVDNVKLQQADITQSWHEFNLDYATAKLQWNAIDYMVHLDKNPTDSEYIESSSSTRPQTIEEIWTFVRSSGGNWLLSAIQQSEDFDNNIRAIN